VRRCLVHTMYWSTSEVAVSAFGAITSVEPLPFSAVPSGLVV